MIEPLRFKPNTESIHFGFSSASRLQTPVNRLHRHDEIELGILEHGSVDAIIGRNRLLIPPDQFVVFWACARKSATGKSTSQVHRNLDSEGNFSVFLAMAMASVM
jgi:hypothetical protein